MRRQNPFGRIPRKATTLALPDEKKVFAILREDREGEHGPDFAKPSARNYDDWEEEQLREAGLLLVWVRALLDSVSEQITHHDAGHRSIGQLERADRDVADALYALGFLRMSGDEKPWEGGTSPWR